MENGFGNTVADADIAKDILHECLSHYELTEEEVEYGSSVLSTMRLSNSNIAKLITYTCSCTTSGKLSLSFSRELVEAIKGKDHRSLSSIANGTYKSLFPELYDNSKLTLSEKSKMDNINHLEYQAILQALEELTMDEYQEGTYCSMFSPVCDNVTQDKTVHEDDSTKVEESIYGLCHKGVCIDQKVIMPIKAPSSVYVPEMSAREKKIRTVYCFDFVSLLKATSKSPYINPVSGVPFTPETLRMLQKRYQVEIKMYQRYVEGLTVRGLADD